MATHSLRQKLNLLRVSLTGGFTAAAFFLLCWLGALLPFGPATHLYLKLFTSAEISSATALIQGVCWSLAFGLIAAGLYAAIYNLLGGFDSE